MTDVFISYSRKDVEFARQLTASLEARGADVWFDQADIHAGVKWSSAIQQGLRDAKAMIVVLSPDAMASPNVEDEWQYFLDRKKPLIPVLLRPADVHFQLSRIQYIDFANQNYDGAFEQLITELAVKGITFAPAQTTPAARIPTPVTLPPVVEPPDERDAPPLSRSRLTQIGMAAVLIVAVLLIQQGYQSYLAQTAATQTAIPQEGTETVMATAEVETMHAVTAAAATQTADASATARWQALTQAADGQRATQTARIVTRDAQQTLTAAPPTTATPTFIFMTSSIEDRIIDAAFNITTGFEGTSYTSYNNRDSGIVSYGRFYFTLASGSLQTLLETYLATSDSETAQALRTYMELVEAQDPALRSDEEFGALLIAAASEPAMQAAQNNVALEIYWDAVYQLSIEPRGIVTPLGQALLFDMCINHGLRNDMITLAEANLGVPANSRLGENGITEQELIAEVVRVRSERLEALAEGIGVPGLNPRGDFWNIQVQIGNWDLLGDANGMLEIRPGRTVYVGG